MDVQYSIPVALPSPEDTCAAAADVGIADAAGVVPAAAAGDVAAGINPAASAGDAQQDVGNDDSGDLVDSAFVPVYVAAVPGAAVPGAAVPGAAAFFVKCIC